MFGLEKRRLKTPSFLKLERLGVETSEEIFTITRLLKYRKRVNVYRQSIGLKGNERVRCTKEMGLGDLIAIPPPPVNNVGQNVLYSSRSIGIIYRCITINQSLTCVRAELS